MRFFLFSLLAAFLLAFLLSPNVAEAQIVSLFVDADKEQDSLKMGREMKKHLKGVGFDVKEITSREGFFLYVQCDADHS